MATHTLKLANSNVRSRAHIWLDHAPDGMLIKYQEPTRSRDQNAKMWAMLADVSAQVEHLGKKHSKEVWKEIFMSACGHELQLMAGLNGEPVSLGHKSSALSVAEMSDLIEFIHCWCAENGVELVETRRRGFV